MQSKIISPKVNCRIENNMQNEFTMKLTYGFVYRVIATCAVFRWFFLCPDLRSNVRWTILREPD